MITAPCAALSNLGMLLINAVLGGGTWVCPGGVIGSRDRLKIDCRKACEFESRPGHSEEEANCLASVARIEDFEHIPTQEGYEKCTEHVMFESRPGHYREIRLKSHTGLVTIAVQSVD